MFCGKARGRAMGTLDTLCRICSEDLKENGMGIFSTECMDKLVGEKIKRYLYFSVSIKDKLPKKVCTVCLKKLDNIHRFAKMAAEMQEKFRMLLSQEESARPKIKLRSIEDLGIKQEMPVEDPADGLDGDLEFDVAVEEVGENVTEPEVPVKENGDIKNEMQHNELDLGETVIKEEDPDDFDEKPNASLLHSLLVQGKSRSSTDFDHDYISRDAPQMKIKDEPQDPEDEDIAEEIEEDRLNQIIKDEMESEYEQEEEEGNDDDEDYEEEEEDEDDDEEMSDGEVMEVKVDPMLYFSNTDHTAIELDGDSEDATEERRKSSNVATSSSASSAANSPLVMTRSQQRVNPVIASLKMGKPYKCTVCPRSFITDIGLQNHLWSHLPKSRKNGCTTSGMMHKNLDLEDSQVYSSNGVLHTAMPSENPHLLKYVCPICGKKISTKGNLKVHLETHRPKGKYGCDICGRVFKTASNLYRHKDYHGGVQFPCTVCGRVYPTNSTLRAHSITHSSLRPHKCPLCSKTFKRNQDLKFHINQHTGARPYQCPYCPKAFASSGNCFSHRKRMHPLEVERDKERAAEIMG